MKEITKHMIKDFNIKKLGYDFMGYENQKGDIYTFHHLIIPRRDGGPSEKWNGAVILTTPHQYLHVIEYKDYEVFAAITSEMIDMNLKGYLDKDNIRYIDSCLNYFEREFSGARTSKGKSLIKPEYVRRRKL